MEFSIFLILITLVSFFLVVVIMVQNPKGGGLSSSFGGSQAMGGVQKTNDFLDKGTWTLATVLIALILLSTLSFSGGYAGGDSKLIDETAVPSATTPAPTSTEQGATTPAGTEEGTPQE
ncbi:preprotein translocase subunit SecG [Flavobacterium arcticum]|uniref:Protein-export membrane protein SecG n=1 Tax=Flavobacterium arcticum TaxID=1784713 RepID=A0A345H9J6_9FLAO|nr:preprotein translocase subunit SecG [Flavobacterium arcticum]AXG73256.1 preprotein translocase subunit SecG [Flavobacterium arcticum]KAF2513051.1 preprotein translocase subunit SecG [Flavobacterium arcticum]